MTVACWKQCYCKYRFIIREESLYKNPAVDSTPLYMGAGFKNQIWKEPVQSGDIETRLETTAWKPGGISWGWMEVWVFFTFGPWWDSVEIRGTSWKRVPDIKRYRLTVKLTHLHDVKIGAAYFDIHIYVFMYLFMKGVKEKYNIRTNWSKTN